MAVKPKAPETRSKFHEKVNPDTGLTDRQERFCEEYLIDMNATRAAVAAGYEKKTAAQQASRLLTKVKVKEYIGKKQQAQLDKYAISQEKTLRAAARLAYSNIGDFLTINREDGTVAIDFSRVGEDELAALDAVEVTELPAQTLVIGGEELEREVIKTKIKMKPSWPAIEALMKRLGLVKEQVEVNVTQRFDRADMSEVARRVAFMLRSAAELKKSKAESGHNPKQSTGGKDAGNSKS